MISSVIRILQAVIYAFFTISTELDFRVIPRSSQACCNNPAQGGDGSGSCRLTNNPAAISVSASSASSVAVFSMTTFVRREDSVLTVKLRKQEVNQKFVLAVGGFDVECRNGETAVNPNAFRFYFELFCVIGVVLNMPQII